MVPRQSVIGYGSRDFSSVLYQRIKETFVHPRYQGRFLHDYDIAVIEVERPFSFNATVNAVKIANKQPRPKDICLSTGWGVTSVSEIEQKL